MELSQAMPSQKVEISAISGDSETVIRVQEMGLIVGRKLEVVRTSKLTGMVLVIDAQRIAISNQIAENIQVATKE